MIKHSLLYFCLFFSFNFFAQNYQKHWNKIHDYEQTGSIKSALNETEKVYKKAKRKNNESEIVKSFFFKSKYLQHLEENAQTLIINDLQKEINELKFPGKILMEYMYVQTLNSYLRANRYKINRRTNVETTTHPDFKTWTTTDFEKEIDTYINKSLQDKSNLKNTFLLKFEGILLFEKREDIQHRNLYEFLIEKYIDLYSQNINQWDKKDSFYQNSKDYLLKESKKFRAVSFDSVPNDYLKKTSKLLQLREKEFPENQNYVLERIQFYNKYVFKDPELLLISLQNFSKHVSDSSLIKELQYEKAKLYNQLASKDVNPTYHKKALDLLNQILAVESRSNTYKNAFILKEQILSKSINFQAQQYVYKNENTRAYINFKNTDSLYIRFYKIPLEYSNPIRRFNRDSLISAVTNRQKPVITSAYKLPDSSNHFSYSTEVSLPKLKIGHYLMVLGTTPSDFNRTSDWSHDFITVTNLAIQNKRIGNDEYFQIVHRKTGQPVSGAEIAIDNQKTITDKQGLAKIPYIKDGEDFYRRTNIFANKNQDSLQTSFYKGGFNTYDDNDFDDEDFPAKVEYFLDRAIYRPGQTVYGKGIAIQKKNGKTRVIPHLSFLIEIDDPNYNTIKEIEVKTNEYGSFTFEFEIPKNGITGKYHIEIDEPDEFDEDDPYYDEEEDFHLFWDIADFEYSEINFSVEEYKRPTFKVETNPITENYVVHDTIEISGKAISFSGVNLSDSKINYSIERNSYPNYRFIYYPQETKIIATGETTTTADGKFAIPFEAIPYSDFDKKDLPVFNYTINIEVTDSRGETQTASATVSVGYHNLKLTASVPPIINTQKENQVHLKSTNLNNEFYGVKGFLEIYFKSEIDTKFKPRQFEKPEISGFSKTEFENLFPFEKSGDKMDSKKLVFSKEINTENTKELNLNFLKDEEIGNYEIVFSAKDSKGNTITTESSFLLIHNEKDNQNKLFTINQINNSPFQDGFAELEIQSQIDNIFITISKANVAEFAEKQIQLQNGTATIQIPLNVNQTENETLYFNSYFENYLFSDSYTVSNNLKTELDINIETFRNKIEPGSEQTWSFSISKNNQAIEAEVLASMYDSSLDQFRTVNWNLLKIEDDYYNAYYDGLSNLSNNKIFHSLKNINPPLPQFTFSNKTVNLYQFGFDFNHPGKYIDPNQSKKASSKIPKNAITVSGIITDETGLPLPGASIIIKGTTRGAQSDFDGFYSIEVAPGEELEFSYVGFSSQTLQVTGSTIDISLDSSSETMDEVVVTAFGSMRETKNNATATVERSKEEMSSLLMGKVSGLTVFEDSEGTDNVIIRGMKSEKNSNLIYIVDGVSVKSGELSINQSDIKDITVLKGEEAVALYGAQAANGVVLITTTSGLDELQNVQTRTNFNETAFFYPELKTDKEGKINFTFISPEALTQWKLRLFAHTKNVESGYLEKFAVTQKELMVAPNLPRFFREKDSITITARISNLTSESKNGQAMLLLFDATTMKPIDSVSGNRMNYQNFQTPPNGNTTVSWNIYIPEGVSGIQYRVVAKSGNYSDGEENLIPVLTNTILVTESIPVWVRENSEKEFVFEKLKNPKSKTLQNHQLTLEYTSNPTWLAIEAMPYLMEYEHDCSEQVFARYYANSMASKILNENPKIKNFFKNSKGKNLQDKLIQNEELKSIIISETPWFRDLQTEEEKQARLALLFDLQRLSEAQENTLQLLKKQQSSNGGFPWFEGGPENQFITTHIIAGFGKMNGMDSIPKNHQSLIRPALKYLDRKFQENIKNLDKSDGIKTISFSAIHYLYARSFYLKSAPVSESINEDIQKILKDLKEDWLKKNLQQKAMMALAFHRFGDTEMAKKILHHLRESSANNEEWGMYWINNKASWLQSEAPIETQALIIEAFDEIEKDEKSVSAMKIWLLKNKQVSHWSSTKSTFEAIDALLRFEKDSTIAKNKTDFKWGNQNVLNKKLEETNELSESGYVKIDYQAEDITNDLATVKIKNKSDLPGFGGFYWQYFEDIENIEQQEDQLLQISKKLYLKKKTTEGEQLQEITSENTLKIGDLVTVRLIISAKENMDFVHLKDLRASGFEPVEVLSKYHYRDGLGYYMSTRDAATHFFFNRINKGTYVLEYDVRANNVGKFSNGITTIQSMYAPEFGSHSEGIRIRIEKK